MATLLAITVLLPLVGSVVLVLLPRLEATEGPADRPGVHAGHAGTLASFPPRLPVRCHHAAVRVHVVKRALRPVMDRAPDIRFALGLDGLSLWLFFLTSLLMITAIAASWESITERCAALLCVSAGPANGPAGAVRQPGCRALLHLLRVHADSTVFPDRPVGGPPAPASSGDVFPVYAGRQLVDLARRDRACGRALSVFAEPRAHVLDPRPHKRPGRSFSGPSGAIPIRS